MSGIDLQISVAYSGHRVSARLEQTYLALMPVKHQASIARYKRWQDRQATLFGKLLLLRALRTKYPADGMRLFQRLETGCHGKPFVQGEPEFNISHSDGMVVLAVARSGSLGIDIEKLRDVNVADFSRCIPEVAHLSGSNDTGQVNAVFFDYWTRKEAVLKGCGKGLMAPLDQVFLDDDMAFFGNTTWFVKKVLLDDNYSCHVATDRPQEHVAVEYVNLVNEDSSSGFFKSFD